jgi:hypothetical protein
MGRGVKLCRVTARFVPYLRTFLNGGLLLAVFLTALVFLAKPSPLSAKEPFTGYFSPLLSEEGDKVFYVMRRTSGRTWGFGWENFTPPAWVKVSADLFSLHRLDVRTGEDETLKVWPGSPLAGRKFRAYRDSRYAIPFVRLRFRGEAALEYEIAFTFPGSGGGTAWRLHGTWDGAGETAAGEGPDDSPVWKEEGYRMTGIAEESVRGALEVLVVPGPASFPAAVVMIDHRDGSRRTLLRSSRFEDEYPEGIPERIIRERSRKEEIDRLRALRKAHRETLKGFRDAGLSEGDALLRTGREMERMGFYPKRPTITARLVAPGEKRSGDDVPTFDISEREFTVGLFQDILKAIENPGVEADKSMGLYVRHRDFTTSELLNAHLKGKGRVFRVRCRGGLYELAIHGRDDR